MQKRGWHICWSMGIGFCIGGFMQYVDTELLIYNLTKGIKPFGKGESVPVYQMAFLYN